VGGSRQYLSFDFAAMTPFSLRINGIFGRPTKGATKGQEESHRAQEKVQKVRLQPKTVGMFCFSQKEKQFLLSLVVT